MSKKTEREQLERCLQTRKVTCIDKFNNKEKTYDFRDIAKHPDVAEIAISAFFEARHKIYSLKTFSHYLGCLKRFLNYIDAERKRSPDFNADTIYEIFHYSTFDRYAGWLRKQHLMYRTLVLYVSSLKFFVEYASEHIFNHDIKYRVPNYFSDINISSDANQPYSDKEINHIVSAIIEELACQKDTLEFEYEPKWKGKPEPNVKNDDWYWWCWENVLDCKPLSALELERRGLNSFYRKFVLPMGKNEFYKRAGVYTKFRIKVSDLLSYYFYVMIVTGWNQQVIDDLKIQDVLIKNDSDGNIVEIRGYKNRSDKYISKFYKDDAPIVDILRRVLKITEHLRKNAPVEVKDKLWFVQNCRKHNNHRFSELSTTYTKAVRDFEIKYNLVTDNGELLHIEARRLRPTAAIKKLQQTSGNIHAVQEYLDHGSSITTRGYLDRLECVPSVLRKMKLHSDAYFVHLTGNKVDTNRLKKDLNLSNSQAKSIAGGEFDTLFCRCKDLYNPPPGRKKSEHGACLEMWNCIGCSLPIFFPEDLHKLFSFKDFIKTKLEHEIINFKQYEEIYKPYFVLIEKEIAPKFPKAMVEEMKTKAKQNPYYVWNTEMIK